MLTEVDASDNSAGYRGGGIYAGYAGNYGIQVSGGSLLHNTAAGGGGFYSDGDVEMDGTTLIGNTSTTGNGGAAWTQMSAVASNLSVSDNIVIDQTPRAGEKVVFKHRYSAFYNTDLETVLRCLRVEDVVISGVMTNLCCESTARDAFHRDYRVFFLADGTGSICEEMHLASLLNVAFGFAYVTTSQAIVERLNGAS